MNYLNLFFISIILFLLLILLLAFTSAVHARNKTNMILCLLGLLIGVGFLMIERKLDDIKQESSLPKTFQGIQ